MFASVSTAWLYVAVGDFGANAVGADGSRATLLSGGVIRMRPDGSDLEVYTQGTRNTYDLAINHRLDIIAMDNTNDGDGWDMRLHHLTPLAHMGYPNLYKHFSGDAMPPLFTYGGGSGCGALYLEEPGFPDWFNRRFHTISWGKIYTHDLTPHEATFVNKDKISLSINKLVDLDVDGSSRLYLTNFENGGARIQPGAIVGHIVQAKPEGWKYREFPDLDAAGVGELITYLDQGSGVLRQNAQWVLINSKAAEVNKLLEIAANDSALSLEARIAALYAINLRRDDVKSLLDDPALQEYALRALLDRPNRDELNLAPIVTRFLDSENPRVRMQAVVGAKKLSLADLTEKLLQLSKSDPRPPLEKDVAHVHLAIPHTAQRALIEMAPVKQLHKALDHSALRTPALAALRQIHTEENVSGLIAALKHGPDNDLIAALLRLYHKEQEWDGESWWGTRPNSAGPYYRGVTWAASGAIAEALRNAVQSMDEAAQKTVLYQVRRHNLDLNELKLPIEVDPMEQLLEQSEHTFQQQPDLLSIVTDKSKPEAMRIAAFRAALDVTGFAYGDWCAANVKALAKIESEESLHQTLSKEFVQSSSHRVTMMGRVPKAYGKLKRLNPAQQKVYFDVLCTLAQSPLTGDQERTQIVNGSDSIPLTTEFLQSMTEHRATAFLRLLKNAAKKDKSEEIEKTIAALTSSQEGQTVATMSIEDITKAALKMSGDTEEGKKLFTRQSCAACHSVLPDEPQKGPYLGTAGNLFTREQLITHVIDPAAEISQGFQGYWFKLKDGSAASGFITARDEKTISLRNITGISQTIKTGEIKEEGTLETSMMPPGLVNTLTLREFASLIDYLQSLH